MILPHFWKLLKFHYIIPSFCCLASWRLASIFRAAMFLLRVLFLCYLAYSVPPHHFLHDCKSESICKHQDSVLHSLPWAHQLRHEALSHLLQTVLGSLQLICSCWEERLEGFQFRYNLRRRMETNNWMRKRICLGRMEESSLCRKFTCLVLDNQSFVSCILQNWHRIPFGSVAFLKAFPLI